MQAGAATQLRKGEIGFADLERLQELEPYAEDSSFLDAFAAIKSSNKVRLATLLERRDGIVLAPIRLGVGLRAGASVGYMHYRRNKSWNPI